MQKFTIKIVATIEDGRFGVFLCDGIPFAVTLERTYDVEGKQFVKIPLGTYRCTRTTYYRGGYPTFEIHVPGHSRILFHLANLETELDGCIAIGEQFGVLKGKPAILQSGKGFDEFMSKAQGLEFFDLEVQS